MREQNPYSSPQQQSTAEPGRRAFRRFRGLAIHLCGYGALVIFASFLVFVAKRYHSVYGWAHQPNRNVSPEQFYQSANYANNAILLVVAITIFFTIRGKYLPGKIIGIISALACMALFIHGCGHVAVRY